MKYFQETKMASTISLDLGDHLNFPSMLFYLALYFIIERALKLHFIHFYPQFYAQLYKERKDIQYFAFLMGILITIFSTPICYKALRESNPSNDTFGNPNLSKAGEICIASRGVLWASELNRLDHSNLYIAHHISSMGYLIYHIQTKHPLRLIYAFYTSLFTEFFSDLSCLLTIHDFRTATSSLAYRTQVMNTILLVFLRLPPILYSAKFVATQPPTTPIFWIDTLCLLIYFRFIVNIILAASKRLKLFQLETRKPAYIRVGQRFDISVYGIFFAVASFLTASVSALVYVRSGKSSPTPNEVSSLGLQLMITGAAAYIGARMPSHIRHGIPALFSTKFLTKSSLWIQGSFFAAILSIAISPLIDRTRLLYAFSIIFPVGESLGRIGCYFAGCCDGMKFRGVPTQILSSFLNGVVAFSILAFWGSGYLSVEEAAAFSLGVNAMIRLLLRPNVFSLGQLLTGATLMAMNAKRMSVVPSKSSIPANETLADFSLRGADSIVEENILKSLWTILLALGSILAGILVQGPAGDDIRAELKRDCDGNEAEIESEKGESSENGLSDTDELQVVDNGKLKRMFAGEVMLK